MAVNEPAKLISLKSPSILFEQLCLSKRNNQNIIILRNNKLGNFFITPISLLLTAGTFSSRN